MSPLEKPLSDASLTFAPPYSCSPEKATIAWYGLLRSTRYALKAWKYWMARSMPLVTTIARACPPIFPAASTCSWKWSTMISALSRIAWSWLSTYRRSFFCAFLVSNSGSSSVFLTSL